MGYSFASQFRFGLVQRPAGNPPPLFESPLPHNEQQFLAAYERSGTYQPEYKAWYDYWKENQSALLVDFQTWRTGLPSPVSPMPYETPPPYVDDAPRPLPPESRQPIKDIPEVGPIGQVPRPIQPIFKAGLGDLFGDLFNNPLMLAALGGAAYFMFFRKGGIGLGGSKRGRRRR